MRGAKRRAARENRTLTSLIEEGLRLVLAEDRGREKPSVAPPRVSVAKGGLQPGVELSDLRDAEDAAFAERLTRAR
jgi:hypothetical protein